MTISRRRFVGNAAKLSASLVAAGLPSSSLFARGRYDVVNHKLLPSEKEVWEGVEFMNGLGVRFSGSSAHQKYVAYVEDHFKSFGMDLDQIPHTSLVRWDLRQCSLKIASGSQAGKDVPISSYCRYTKTTGSDGATGELVYCGKAEGGPSLIEVILGISRSIEKASPRTMPTIPADLQGKIALVEVVAEPLPYGALWKDHIRGVYNSEGNSDFPAVQKTAPAYGAAALPMSFNADLAKAGTIGVIYAWSNLADDDAAGQMKVGSSAISEVWVGQTAGRELRALADSGGTVTLTVEADTVPNVPTHTTLATLAGTSADEVILLWTHTDGNNAIEENGGIAILNLMKYFSRLPQSARKRTIACVLSEAHFNEEYIPRSAWLKERPDLVHKAVAEVSIEHLGCGEWIDNPGSNSYKGTGAPELAFAFCPMDPMSDVMLESVRGTKSGKTAVIDSEMNAFTPAILFYRLSHIPFIGFICAPPYLVAEGPHGHIEKLSSSQFHEQMTAFANVIHRLDSIPKSELRTSG